MSMRRALSLLTAAALLCAALPAAAAGPTLPWPADMTDAQTELAACITTVNELLMANGERPVNSLFECYPGFAVLGITGEDNAETPEDVEITVTLGRDHIAVLELMVRGWTRFPLIAGAFLMAATAGQLTLKDAMATPKAVADRAEKAPTNSFGDEIIRDPGETLRAYYTYTPELYKSDDGGENNYLTLTLVLPFQGIASGAAQTAPPVEADRQYEGRDDQDAGWEGYDAEDDYTHFDVYISPTPEPYIPVN